MSIVRKPNRLVFRTHPTIRFNHHRRRSSHVSTSAPSQLPPRATTPHVTTTAPHLPTISSCASGHPVLQSGTSYAGCPATTECARSVLGAVASQRTPLAHARLGYSAGSPTRLGGIVSAADEQGVEGHSQRISRLSPALAPLWSAFHKRLSTGRPVQRVKVGPLDPDQQAALADLLGLSRLPGQYKTISLMDLDEVLADITGCTTYDVVEHLLGPVGDRAAELRNAAEERDQLWAWLSEHEVVAAQPALGEWVVAIRRSGLIAGSTVRTQAELERALQVLHELPSAGTPLPVFADSVLGDPHGLDEGSRLHTMVVRGLAVIYGIDPPTDAGQLRALWDRAGIADDEISSTVLAAGLLIDGGTAVGRILRECAGAGQAAALTLQQLRALPRIIAAPSRVWVVENPSVLAVALARFGDCCPPLVCTSGWPSSAGVLLLQLLAQAGAELCYHGDFDGEGLRIAANVIARVGAVPWRMTTADYLNAVGEGPAVGRVTPVPWDLGLSAAMTRVGVAVPEERVAHRLLDEVAELHVR
ncbi:TIGR02679 family protein [Nocardia sp. CA-129566]|uniref:TIGR02679 family protein n=1 Tax=Nocardia sp. CA-129566 TaxID=3239976 RepID=UPI003D9964A5